MKSKNVFYGRNRCTLILGWLISSGCLGFTSPPVCWAGMRVGHACVEVTKIPVHWVEQVKQQNILLHCVGQSHSKQYKNGLEILQQEDPRFAVQISTDLFQLTEPNVLHVLTSQFSTAYNRWGGDSVDDGGYWSTEDGREMTRESVREALRQQFPITASLWCWCWDICRPQTFYSQSDDFTESDILTYLETIQSFCSNTAINSTKFVFHTSVSDCSSYLNPDGPWRVTYFNDYIRDYVQQNDGILMDQADIENWNIDNTEQYITTDEQGRMIYPRHPDYNESNPPDTMDGDHANDALCLRKAAALWYLAARLAGWNGCPAITGDVNGDCVVNIYDFYEMAKTWLTDPESPDWNPACDIAPEGGDGIIDSRDFTLISQNWQKVSCIEENSADVSGDCRVDLDDLSLLSSAWIASIEDHRWDAFCDIAPPGGDGRVDYLDLGYMGRNWKQTNCGGFWPADFTNDCYVNLDDLNLLADAWISTPQSSHWNPICDIAPIGGDDNINMLDYALFCRYWHK